jgi:hypothetical protein
MSNRKLIEAKKLILDGKTKESFQLILELENDKDLTPQEILSCKIFKAKLLSELGKYQDGFNITDEILNETLQKGDLVSSLDALLIQIFSYSMLGDIFKSKLLIERAEKIYEEIKKSMKEDYRDRESFLIRMKANMSFWKGEIHHSFELNRKAFELVKDTDNKELKSASLINIAENFQLLGNYDKAIVYAKRALEIGYYRFIPYQIGIIIDIFLDIGDIENAKLYLQRLHDYRKKEKNKAIEDLYHYHKAVFLKTSLRAKNRLDAEILLKQLIKDKRFPGERPFWAEKRVYAIIHLCDLLLIELRITNDLEVLNDLKENINRLLEFAEQLNSYWVLAEAHLLQAKLSLVNLDIRDARQFLTEAQLLAEKYGLNQLAVRISNEHDELLKKLEFWENLKKRDASVNERIELARINEQMGQMLHKKAIESPEILEEHPVIILIITEGGIPIFSRSFEEGWSFEDHLFSGFLTAVNSFSDELFSKGLDRASFGEHTLLMKSIKPFLVCYLFKGQTFPAQQRFRFFSDKLKKSKIIWKKFQKYYETNQIVQQNDIPLLESLITEIFIYNIININSLKS